jgi:signal transduction histidine kinase
MRRIAAGLGLLVVWSIPGLLSASATLLLFPNSPTIGGDVRRFVVISIAPWWGWVLLTPPIVGLARRLAVDERRARTVAIHVVAGVVVALLYVLAVAIVGWLVVRHWPITPTSSPGVVVRPAMEPRQPESLLMLYRGMISSRFPTGLIVYVTLAGIGVAIEERRRRRARELEASKLEAHLARAQLQALQMQLQPHFLFNTLHAISLLVDENPRAASRMIIQLGDLLRESLSLSDTHEVPLSREIELLRQYLAIEQARFGPRLSVDVDVPSGVEQTPVPSFLLQPIVENAVRHGVAPRIEPGRVSVRAVVAGNRLQLIVSDDGPGFGRAPAERGLGLAATRDRLAVRYRGAASLRCESSPAGGAVVTIEIPLG